LAEPALDLIEKELSVFPALQMHRTRKGALLVRWQGQADDAPRALTAHADTLGAMVKEIKSNGRLKLTKIGGFAWNTVEGEGCWVFSSDGGRVRGSLLLDKSSSHVHGGQVNETRREDENMEVRLDARTTTASGTENLGIRVGDFVAFDPRVEVTDGFIRSRHLDDKASIAAIYGAVAALAEAGLTPKQTTTIHISNYEEVGHGAAAGFPADLVDLLTIDMAVVAPKQTSDEYSVTICAKDSAGPYHMAFRRELEALAAAHHIPYQTDIYPHYGSDGESFWRAGGNVRVGLIGPGVAASHHYERTHRDALENTAKLIAAYLLS
jgi:putative aminopeptidase FrvX